MTLQRFVCFWQSLIAQYMVGFSNCCKLMFMPELRHLAHEAELTVAAEGAWMSSACPDATTWNAWMLVRK